MGFELADHELLCASSSQKASVILVGLSLNETENQAILHDFEQVSSQQVLVLDGGAISLFAASQFDLPEAQLSLHPIKKNGKNYRDLI